MHRLVSSLLALAGISIVAVAPGQPRAASLTNLVSFCALANCADSGGPVGALIADANGNLFGTTSGQAGAGSGGTAFEITDSGFIVSHKFAGMPGSPNCFAMSVAALAGKYGGLNAAAAALGYPSVQALQEAIMEYCEA